MKLIKEILAEKGKSFIYGRLFGLPDHEITEISVDKLSTLADGTGIVYQYGMSNDVIFYYFKDYGKTLAYEMKDFEVVECQ